MWRSILRVCVFLVPMASAPVRGQVAHVLQGAGAINRSMEGAATGNPVDPCGALYWNPAGLTAFDGAIVCVESELFKSHLRLGSSAPVPGGQWGSEQSHVPLAAIPTVGMFFSPEGSDWAFAVGLNSIAGFGVNFDAAMPGAGNPVLYPQAAGGFGGIQSDYQLAQLFLGAGYRVTPRLSIGLGPLLSYARLDVDPFSAAAPTATGYPEVETAGAFGVGINGGILYRVNEAWSVGAAYRSRVAFQAFDFDASVGPGFSFDLDFPSIQSIGVGYTGLDRWAFNVDVRRIDYEGTDGFSDDARFGPNSAVGGFGWNGVWLFAAGVQYRATEKLTLRAGYAYNTNPIPDELTFFNVHAPAIIQHHASVGLSYRFNDRLLLNFTFSHGFRNSIAGPMYMTNNTPVPGSRVKSEMSTDSLVVGFAWTF